MHGGARGRFVFNLETSQQLIHITILTPSPNTQPASPSAKRLLTILGATDLCTLSIVVPFPEYHEVGVIEYIGFSD